MNLLLDTHVLIWWMKNNPRLGRKARALIQSPETDVRVSAVSIWDLSIKAALQRLGIDRAFYTLFPEELNRQGFRKLPITFEHALALRDLPSHHSDPFDRMLVVQAKLEALTLMAADTVLGRYGILTADAAT